MAHVYEKTTKDMIDLPAYVLHFLTAIVNKLEFYGLITSNKAKLDVKPPSTLILPIVSRKYEYCFDGVNLIEKTLKRRGFDCKMERYKKTEIDEKDGSKSEGYHYEYKISKSK